MIKRKKLQSKFRLKFHGYGPETKICEVGISVRLIHVIMFLEREKTKREGRLDEWKEYWEKVVISDLAGTSVSKVSSLRNAGNQTVWELQALCFCAGVKLEK